MSEFDRIRRFFAEPAEAQRKRLGRAAAWLGIGDDCALLEPSAQALAISSDMLLLGRHFHADVDPESLGHKALAVNLSDLAAMGAEPIAFMLSMALDRDQDDRWLSAFSRGLFSLADSHRCELIGGDTTAGPLCLSLTVIGQVPQAFALRRDAAKPGDQLWVSGRLGAAAFALKYPGRCEQADECLNWPVPRVELGMALRGISQCALDLSDGLLGDVVHILERSRLGVMIFADRLPLHPVLEACPEDERLALALQGGDDYELLFTARPQGQAQIHELAKKLDLELSCIGEMTADHRREILDARGIPLAMPFRGYDHFA
ncbi:MAG: thiamine-phosphate kinase [Proteobacteria bacterium]|nr:thiamine-phosphate kinase [Pseudomonadota bacterium]NDI22319.1 thiamine-phosphate kinase [Betaproteobacteria bacterium]